MKKSFRGRALLPGDLEGEAVVTHSGFNTYASFYTSIHAQVEAALCADSGNRELMTANHLPPAVLPMVMGAEQMPGLGFGLGFSVMLDVALLYWHSSGNRRF